MKQKYSNITSKISTGIPRRLSTSKKSSTRFSKSKILIPLNSDKSQPRTVSKTPKKRKSKSTLRSSRRKRVKRSIREEILDDSLERKTPLKPKEEQEIEEKDDPEEMKSPRKLKDSLKNKIAFLKKRKKYIGRKQWEQDKVEIEDLEVQLERAIETEKELERIQREKRMISIEKGLSKLYILHSNLMLQDQIQFFDNASRYYERLRNLEILAKGRARKSLLRRGLLNLSFASKQYRRRFLFIRNFAVILKYAMNERKRHVLMTIFRILKKKKKVKPFHLVSQQRKKQREMKKKARKERILFKNKGNGKKPVEQPTYVVEELDKIEEVVTGIPLKESNSKIKSKRRKKRVPERTSSPVTKKRKQAETRKPSVNSPAKSPKRRSSRKPCMKFNQNLIFFSH